MMSRGIAMRLAALGTLALAASAMPNAASADSTLPAYTVTEPGGVQNVAALAVDSASHRVYAASGSSQAVVVVDGITRSVLATIAVPFLPSSMVIDPATHRLFVLGSVTVRNPLKLTISLSIVDTATNTVIATVPAATNLFQKLVIDTANRRVYAFPSVFDETGKSLPALPPIGRPTALAFDPGIQRMYVVDSNLGTVTVYNSLTYKWVANVTVSHVPSALAVDPGTHSLYVSDPGDAVVTVIDGTTDAVAAKIAIGGAPGAIAVDPTAGLVYATNMSNVNLSGRVSPGTVAVIDARHNTVANWVSAPDAGAADVAVDSLTHTVWLAASQLNALDPIVSRRAGSDRFGTAAAISGAGYDPQGADAVVLARSDTYPDALVGAPFAASKNAPLLYTSGTSLPAGTSAEITRVLAPGKTVYLLGGLNAIALSIETQLTSMGYVVSRISGTDRFATAVAVADAMGDPSVVFLATAANYADALAAGPAAATAKGTILLTDGTSLSAATSAYLQAHPGTTYAVGGPAATSDPSATAIVGIDRYATAELVAQQFFTAPATVGLASGSTFADALPAAAYLARLGGPLLLTDPNALPATVSAYLSAARSSVTKALVFGGTSAVTTAAQIELSAALGR